MPCNIINLSDITCHWEWSPLKSCPLSEDFVTYNRLRPARPTWFAPHRRTLSCTTDFNPLGQHDFAPRWRTLSCTMDFDLLGQHDLPLVGGLCHVQRTSTRWATWFAPHRRTLSCTTDFDPLGLNDHTTRYSINKQTNDTSRVTPRTMQNEYPKTNYYW